MGGASDHRIILQPGDIYVSLKDVTQSADLLGAVSRVPGFIASGRLTQDTVKLEFKAESAPRDYIYWLLRTPEYRAYCKAHATGTTNLGLTREDFFSFGVPTLTDQRATLVAIIQSIDDKIELNRRYRRKAKMTKLKAKLEGATGEVREKILYKIRRLSPLWTEPAKEK